MLNEKKQSMVGCQLYFYLALDTIDFFQLFFFFSQLIISFFPSALNDVHTYADQRVEFICCS